MTANGTSVLFLSPGRIGPDSPSPARRALKLAEAVAHHCRVTLAAPSPSDFPQCSLDVLETGPVHDQELDSAMARHDVVVTQTMASPRQLLAAMRHARRLVVDLIAPLALEEAEVSHPGRRRQALAHWRAREMVTHLAAADLVVCSNEKQRDLLTGVALGAGLLSLGDGLPGLVRPDRIVVVPQGVDEEPPRHTRGVLRGSGSIGKFDRVATWAGGAWSWMDPLTPVKAIELLRERRPDLKLVFVGTEHPDATVRSAHQDGARAAAEYARNRGLYGNSVVFSRGWLSYEDYQNALLESDVGVATARPTLESRFASRARVADYLGAGLPVVCTANDVMSEFVDEHGLGRVIEPLAVEACAEALDLLTAEGCRRGLDRAALAPLHWSRVARPLVDYCVTAAGSQPDRAAARAVLARNYPAFVRAVYNERGTAAFARGVFERVKKGVRRSPGGSA